MLITDAYRDLNARQHQERPEWGRQSMKYWQVVKDFCDSAECKTFLDYGCGKKMLKEALEPMGYSVTCYDPAFPDTAQPPEPHKLVVCTDVLEHIEPECLEAVLRDLQRVTLEMGFFVIATRQSLKMMVDGSTPHLIVQPAAWWYERLDPYFKVVKVLDEGSKYTAILVKPR